MLTSFERDLHERTLAAGRVYEKAELDLIGLLRQIEVRKIHRKLERKTLFDYVVGELGFDGRRAYLLTSVMQACVEVPALANVLEERKLSVCKASRLVSVLSADNAESLIEMACRSSWRAIEAEVAKIKPRKPKPRVRVLSEDLVEVSFRVSKAVHAKLQRVEALAKAEVLEACLDLYLERFDPVRKAERAARREETADSVRTENKASERAPAETVRAIRSESWHSGRRPLTAQQKHAVFRRDRGRCTHVDAQGKRCDSDRYVQLHHIHPVSQGGGNEPENLTTLCSFHHDLVHQLTRPLEGQVSWLREPQAQYG